MAYKKWWTHVRTEVVRYAIQHGDIVHLKFNVLARMRVSFQSGYFFLPLSPPFEVLIASSNSKDEQDHQEINDFVATRPDTGDLSMNIRYCLSNSLI